MYQYPQMLQKQFIYSYFKTKSLLYSLINKCLSNFLSNISSSLISLRSSSYNSCKISTLIKMLTCKNNSYRSLLTSLKGLSSYSSFKMSTCIRSSFSYFKVYRNSQE